MITRDDIRSAEQQSRIDYLTRVVRELQGLVRFERQRWEDCARGYARERAARQALEVEVNVLLGMLQAAQEQLGYET